jgi:hypothetical protein
VRSGETVELGSAPNLLDSIWITLSPVLPSSPAPSVLYTYDEAAYMDRELRPCTEGTTGCLHWFSVRGGGARLRMRLRWQRQPQAQLEAAAAAAPSDHHQNDHSAALFCCPSVQAVVFDPSYPIMFVCTGEGSYATPRGEEPMVVVNECDQGLDVMIRYTAPAITDVISMFPMTCRRRWLQRFVWPVRRGAGQGAPRDAGQRHLPH